MLLIENYCHGEGSSARRKWRFFPPLYLCSQPQPSRHRWCPRSTLSNTSAVEIRKGIDKRRVKGATRKRLRLLWSQRLEALSGDEFRAILELERLAPVCWVNRQQCCLTLSETDEMCRRPASPRLRRPTASETRLLHAPTADLEHVSMHLNCTRLSAISSRQKFQLRHCTQELLRILGEPMAKNDVPKEAKQSKRKTKPHRLRITSLTIYQCA